MRRKDREVTDPRRIKGILDDCKTCHLAMVDSGQPYVIPLSYAYAIEEGLLTLYFHSAKEGRKISILRENSAVCFEICSEGEPISAADTPCESGYYFSCVHGFGNAEFVDDVSEKIYALSLLMKHQADVDVTFTQVQADTVCIFKVVTSSYTGKAIPRK